MTHEPPHNAALPKTPFAKLCFSIAALEPFQPDILGSYRDGYTAAKNAALVLVEDSALGVTHKPPQGIDGPNCAHKLLKKQMVGEQCWYACECGQKFRIEAWDGKVSVLAPPDPRKDLAALLEGPYNGQSPFVQAIERGYEKWESEGNCRELGCGCVTVFIFDEVQRWLAEMRPNK